MNLKNQLRAVDFFCGAGGMTYGFTKAGIRVLAGIDIDSTCKETYEKNNKNSKFINRDISKLNEQKLARLIGIRKKDNNLIFIGCSPCQYYSNIQTEKAKSKKSRMLLFDFQRFVAYFLPAYVVIENVPGIESKKGSPLQKFRRFLSDNGYTDVSQVINAYNFNVPQTRRRYLLIATRLRTAKKHLDLPKRVKNQNKLTVRNYIGIHNGFPVIPFGNTDLSDFKHTTADLEFMNFLRLISTPSDGGSRLAWKDNPELQLHCYIDKDETFPDVYGRMHWDLPSPTLTTKFLSISNGRFGHPVEDRAISLREGAVLQTFPKRYKFISDHTSKVARMIGNAVPPELAKRIGKAIIKSQMPLKNGKKSKKTAAKTQKKYKEGFHQISTR